MKHLQDVVEFYLLLCCMGAVRLVWIFCRQEWRHGDKRAKLEDPFHRSYVFWLLNLALIIPVINIPIWLLYLTNRFKNKRKKP